MMSSAYDLLCNILSFVLTVIAVLSLMRYAVFERMYGTFSLKPDTKKLALSIFSFIVGTAFFYMLFTYGFHLLGPFCFVLYSVFCYLVAHVCLVLVELRMEEVYAWYEASPDKHYRVWLEKRCWIFELPKLYPSFEEWSALEE